MTASEQAGIFNTEGSWPEDYKHENGCYQCRCYNCEKLFLGHKRRVICKRCDTELQRDTTQLLR